MPAVGAAPTATANPVDGELAAELLARGLPIELKVGGQSMWPLVRSGDIVRVEPGLAPSLGSLAAVLRRGHLVVHRVVDVRAQAVVLQGDNGGRPEVTARAAVLGVVTRQARGRGGTVEHGSRQQQVRNALIACISRTSGGPWRALGALARLRARLLGHTAATRSPPVR